MIAFLTYNDPPGGVYNSQVIDVCRFVSEEMKVPVKLIAFISLRGFNGNRSKIKSRYKDAIVVPMVPFHRNWRMNRFTLFLLCRLYKLQGVIARGPFATSLAISAKKKQMVQKVCFDARGAYWAEFNEYEVVADDSMKKTVASIEERAVTEADIALAVSHELVKYWEQKYNAVPAAYTVIPCTLGGRGKILPSSEELLKKRTALGFTEDDIVLAYSGSIAGWQSMDQLQTFLLGLMQRDQRIKVLLMAQKGLPLLDAEAPGRVKTIWVEAGEVFSVLAACDHGVLLRSKSITNKVSSPTKFAEYLEAGLSVLISEEIGDFTAFVREKQCGEVVKEGGAPALKPVSYERKKELNNLALTFFTKQQHRGNYKQIIEKLTC